MRKAKAKKVRPRQVPVDEVLPEYDFSRSRANKYAARYAQGSIGVTLDPDVAAVFPRAREVNNAPASPRRGDPKPQGSAAVAAERITSQPS